MTSLPKLSIIALLLIPVTCGVVVADWTESVDGDLSNDPLAPTVINFATGTNTITGTMQSGSDTRDFFTFNIATGQQLTGIFLLDYTDVNSGGNGNTGFAHIDDGTQTVIPAPATAGDFLGGSHLNRTVFPLTTDNVLETLALAPNGGIGFSTPLGPGDYTFNVQQTSTQLTSYSLQFVVTQSIPEPGMATMLSAIAFGLLYRRRR